MIAIIITTSLGLVFGFLISLLDHKLNQNKTVTIIKNLLPGYNCNRCGYGNCLRLAMSLSKNGLDALNKCFFLKDNDKQMIINQINKK